MTTTYDQIQAGWSAHGRDGDKIGDIEEIGQNYLLVTKGLIFPKDLYIPMDVVQSVDDAEGRVILNVDKSQVDDMGWDEPPETGSAWSGTGTAAGQDVSSNTGWTEGSDQTLASQGGYGTRTDTDTDVSSDRMRVPVHEEQLRAERTRDQAGEVRVDKNVIEEERTLDVPVSREEVEVRRVATDRPATGDETAFSGGDTIRVPVTAERVEVTKEPHVVEELEISKRQVTENQQVSDTVRREEVNVDDTSTGGSSTGQYGTNASYGTSTDASYTGGTTTGSSYDRDDDDTSSRGRGGEVGGEAVGGGAGALGGAAVGGAVGGPPGAVIGGVVGAAGGALAGEKAEGGDEEGGSAAGGGGGALAGAVAGGAVAGPPGAVVGGAVGAGAGGAVGDKAQEDDDDDLTRR